MRREIFYSIKTKQTSSKKLCDFVNRVPSNQGSIECTAYEGGGVWIETCSDPMGVKKKIERISNVELGDPQYKT